MVNRRLGIYDDLFHANSQYLLDVLDGPYAPTVGDWHEALADDGFYKTQLRRVVFRCGGHIQDSDLVDLFIIQNFQYIDRIAEILRRCECDGLYQSRTLQQKNRNHACAPHWINQTRQNLPSVASHTCGSSLGETERRQYCENKQPTRTHSRGLSSQRLHQRLGSKRGMSD